jgi:hypothetical protein
MEDVLWEAGIACFSLAHEFTPVLMGSVLLALNLERKDTYYDNAKKTKKMSNTDPIINRG